MERSMMQSNFFTGEHGTTTYREPENVPFYRSEVKLDCEFDGVDKVGLYMNVDGNGQHVVVGIAGEDDMQQFLYEAAVRSKLIVDGEPLILMKKVSAEDAA